ncbi:hypothetical protein GCM10009754_53460 [Amycolatopsis minnesotensis]|uniref:Uncharacterized protein n=1 Tax=Amycolatopsis minnesotensis TaxID=337894 RepID=A0ABP5D0W0_9PSEU
MASRGVVVAQRHVRVYPRGRSITVRIPHRHRSRELLPVGCLKLVRQFRTGQRIDAGGYGGAEFRVLRTEHAHSRAGGSAAVAASRPRGPHREAGLSVREDPVKMPSRDSDASGSPLIHLEAWIGQEGHV